MATSNGSTDEKLGVDTPRISDKKENGAMEIETPKESKFQADGPTNGVLKAIDEKFPQHLDTQYYPHTVEIRKDKHTARYTGIGNHANDFGSVRTERPIPVTDVYYYEVEIVNAGSRGSIAIGFGTKKFNLTRQVGSDKNSVGYRGDDGKKYYSTSHQYGPYFSTGDVIGCGVSFSQACTVFYTKNGRCLGTAFEGIRGELYPTVSLHSPNEMVHVNLGQHEFKYDIGGHKEDEKAHFDKLIQNTPVEKSSLSSLIRDYLEHSAYYNTLQAFDAASGIEDNSVLCPQTPPRHGDCKPTTNNSTPSPFSTPASTKENHSSHNSGRKTEKRDVKEKVNAEREPMTMDVQDNQQKLLARGRVRQYIMEGKIQTAIEHIRDNFQGVLQRNLLFKLNCQRFVELMRYRKADKAIKFAKENIASAFGTLSSEERDHLCKVMGMVAYEDPNNSPVAYLLSDHKRQELAITVNACIAEHLGKSRRSGLERILRQLAATQEKIAELNHSAGASKSAWKVSDDI